jgi:hypothetical protein
MSVRVAFARFEYASDLSELVSYPALQSEVQTFHRAFALICSVHMGEIVWFEFCCLRSIAFQI